MTRTTIESIQERLGQVFTGTFHIDVPAPETDLLDSGILDSLQFVELLYQLERRFGLQLKIEEIELDDLRSLERIARLVSRHIDARGTDAERPPLEVSA